MESNKQSNTNPVRNSFNARVSKLSMLGSSRKVQWDSKRRNTSI